MAEYSLQRVRAGGDLIRELKNKPCKDCGVRYPYYVMQYDHVGEKKFQLSKAWGKAHSTILKEIENCELVCANCHAERTHHRKLIRRKASDKRNRNQNRAEYRRLVAVA
jgi:hypothetical protein